MKTWKSKRSVCRSRKSGRFASRGRCRAFKRSKVKKPANGFLF
jgi:hypothetical protein